MWELCRLACRELQGVQAHNSCSTVLIKQAHETEKATAEQ